MLEVISILLQQLHSNIQFLDLQCLTFLAIFQLGTGLQIITYTYTVIKIKLL